VSNTDFFRDLAEHALPGFGFSPVTMAGILDGSANLDVYGSLVVADVWAPGNPTDAQRTAFAEALRGFSERAATSCSPTAP
jgi:hypothetical protein